MSRSSGPAREMGGTIFAFARLASDQKFMAEREWSKPKLAPKRQQPCDIGLFGDDHLQLDLVEMLQDPDPQ